MRQVQARQGLLPRAHHRNRPTTQNHQWAVKMQPALNDRQQNKGRGSDCKGAKKAARHNNSNVPLVAQKCHTEDQRWHFIKQPPATILTPCTMASLTILNTSMRRWEGRGWVGVVERRRKMKKSNQKQLKNQRKNGVWVCVWQNSKITEGPKGERFKSHLQPRALLYLSLSFSPFGIKDEMREERRNFLERLLLHLAIDLYY